VLGTPRWCIASEHRNSRTDERVHRFAQADRPAIAKLPGPVAELMAAVVGGVGLHALQQGIAAEHLRELRRRHVGGREAEQFGDFARVRDQARRAHWRGLDLRVGRARDLAHARAALRVGRQLAQETVVEAQGGHAMQSTRDNAGHE
jgi:hypothetical protein